MMYTSRTKEYALHLEQEDSPAQGDKPSVGCEDSISWEGSVPDP